MSQQILIDILLSIHLKILKVCISEILFSKLLENRKNLVGLNEKADIKLDGLTRRCLY